MVSIRDRNNTACKRKELAALACINLQGEGQTFKNLIGNRDRATLFEPRIPGDAHASEPGDFISSESWSSSPANIWQPKLLRVKTRTTSFQKIGKFCPFSHSIAHTTVTSSYLLVAMNLLLPHI